MLLKRSVDGLVRETSQPAHLFELDVLRGVLSWWVVLCHILWFSGYREASLPALGQVVAHGEFAVEVFMMLSGFVITKLLIEKKENYPVFITRRFFRLFPAFLVATLLAILLRPLIWSVLSFNWRPAATYEFSAFAGEQNHFIPHLFAHLSMLHGIVPSTILPFAAIAFLVPAWSISLEFQYYLVAPFFAFVDRKFGIRGWVPLVCLSVVAYQLFEWKAKQLYPFPSFLLGGLPFFLVGITSYWIYLEVSKNNRLLPGRLLFAGVPLVYCLTKSIPLTIWVAAFSLIIGSTKSVGFSFIKNFLNRPSLRFLGAISYSTYLIHYPLLWVAKAIVLRLAPDISRIGMAVSLFVVVAPMTLVCSALLYHFVEKPGIQLGRWLTKKLR
jgi:peptidoglycan/LPS O-acetylase OafA/YrhL